MAALTKDVAPSAIKHHMIYYSNKDATRLEAIASRLEAITTSSKELLIICLGPWTPLLSIRRPRQRSLGFILWGTAGASGDKIQVVRGEEAKISSGLSSSGRTSVGSLAFLRHGPCLAQALRRNKQIVQPCHEKRRIGSTGSACLKYEGCTFNFGLFHAVRVVLFKILRFTCPC